MAKYFLVYLIFLLSIVSFATELDPYYQKFLGEKDYPLYYGKFYPDFQYDPYMGEIHNIDDEVNTKYQYRGLTNSLYDLDVYLRTEFTSGVLCPNEMMAEHINYIQYSFRLVNLSYLFEAIINFDELAQKFSRPKECKTDARELLNKCEPKTQEMKYFKAEALGFIENIKEIRKKSGLSDIEFKSLGKVFEKKEGLFSKRLDSYCTYYKCSSNIEKDTALMCKRDKELFLSICSEEDRFLGMNSTAHPYYLLSRSNIVNNFNEMGYALGCMRRYSQLMRHKEDKNLYLANIFPTIKEKLEAKFGERFLQGMLFIPGALKEFREKGLVGIFDKHEKIAQAKPVLKANPKTSIAPKLVLPKKDPIKLVAKVNKERKEKEKKGLRSAFKQAVDLLNELSLDKVSVDMVKFKYDYIFTSKMKESLAGPLDKFIKQKSIKEMKKFDALGTKKGPVPLTFLKYMIDTNKHQGLYNLKIVLGEKFYVKNNIDEKSNEIVFINLENNPQTNYQWQLSILSEDY